MFHPCPMSRLYFLPNGQCSYSYHSILIGRVNLQCNTRDFHFLVCWYFPRLELIQWRKIGIFDVQQCCPCCTVFGAKQSKSVIKKKKFKTIVANIFCRYFFDACIRLNTLICQLVGRLVCRFVRWISVGNNLLFSAITCIFYVTAPTQTYFEPISSLPLPSAHQKKHHWLTKHIYCQVLQS